MSGVRWPAPLRWLALFGVWFNGLPAASALAEPAPARAESDPRGPVEIVLVGELASDPVFAARVSSWFALGQLRVIVHSARFLDPKQVLAPSADAGVHVWVTLDENALARLYFASARGAKGGPSYFLRELRLERGLDEIGAEHVAEVLNLSTLAFLEGQAESAREELEQKLRAEPAVEQPKPAPQPPPVPQLEPQPAAKPSTTAAGGQARGRSWSARVGYAASFRADEGTWHGPHAAFEVALWQKLGLRVAAQAALPTEQALGPLELRFYGASFQLAPSLRHAVVSGSSLELHWFAGPALELVRYAPTRPLNASYGVSEAATEARPALAWGVAASWGRGPVVGLVAQATLPLTRTHYDVVLPGSREVIGRASLVVPTLAVEVGF